MSTLAAIWSFLGAVVTNRSKDLFVARLGTTLLLAKFGIVGPWAEFLGYFVRGFVGVFIDEGIYVIDVTLDAIKAAMSIEEFKDVAKTQYEKAKRKDLTDAEKAQIRQEYLDTLDRFTRLRMQHDADTQQ